MLALADVQAHVRDALLTGEGAALRPLLSSRGDAQKRFAIHQRHYATSLVTSLLDRFPATMWLLGSVAVAEAARQFVRRHPPVRPCIAEYGDEFPAFLAGWPPVVHLQYLRDFAELEWRFSQVAIEVDRPPLAITHLVALDADKLADAVVTLQPGLRYWHASWPTDELFNAYLLDSAPDRFEMKLGSVYLEVRGARGDARIERLSLANFTFRTALDGQRSLGEAIDRSVEADPQFDPSQAFVALVADGLITRIDVPHVTGMQ